MAESESKKYVQQFERYFTNDEPVPYKDLLIYPAQVKDYFDFYMAVNILTIEKNKIPDPKVISMSYLDFIFYQMDNDLENGQYYGFMFVQILKQCLHIDDEDIMYKRNDKGKIELFITIYADGIFEDDEFLSKVFGFKKAETLINLNIIEKIKNEEISAISNICGISIDSTLLLVSAYKRCKDNFKVEKQIQLNKEDFDNIRWIIVYQNMPDYDDTYYDPKVEESLKEAQEFLNRNTDKLCGFEDQKICAKLATYATFDEINNWSLRKFNKILERFNIKLNYEICKTGEMSGMVTFKSGAIKHWMSEIKHEKYKDLLVDFNSTTSKLGQDNNFVVQK
jgi:hypothetical protein